MPRHAFDYLKGMMPLPSDAPEVAGRKATRYFAAVEAARKSMALDSATTGMPRKSEWDFRQQDVDAPQSTVSTQELTEDDENDLPPEVIAAIMSHAKANYDEETCAKLEKHFGIGAEDDEGEGHPVDFPGRPRTGGSMNDDSLIDELRAQGRVQGARDMGARVQTSRNRGADALMAKRNAMGQDEQRRIAMDSKDATGGISYSDVAARMMGGRPRQAGSSKQMAQDSRQRQLREYGSHSASDFMASEDFETMFPDAKRIRTVIG
ncbi:hypothetical protein SAMN05519103_01922 [Rhizobiales bacterium GAS113]|nr:hypothetical protein SAMN05519103_01922 [Rhizobiales bacterium GAS113]